MQKYGKTIIKPRIVASILRNVNKGCWYMWDNNATFEVSNKLEVGI